MALPTANSSGKNLLYFLDETSLERQGLQPPDHHLSSFALRIPAGSLQEGTQSGWMVHRMSEEGQETLTLSTVLLAASRGTVVGCSKSTPGRKQKLGSGWFSTWTQ